MFCQCGAQQGYPHADDCPFPYYGHSEAMIAKWLDARNAKPALAAVSVSAETAQADQAPRIVYGPEIEIAQIVDEETLQILDAEWNNS